MSTDMMERESESSQMRAMASMPTDVALLRMENDQIFAVAKASPRDPAKIVRQLADLIEAYPAAAAGAIYSKPVGTVMEVTCGKCGIRYQVQKVEKDTECVACGATSHGAVRPVKKFAEGLSIRAAETIRSIYGYTRLATKTELIDDDKVRVTGTVVDYASGNITSDERIVSPWYRSKGGAMTKTPEDRFLNVVVKAEKSKLRRDIILDNTPAIVKTAFRDMCEAKNGLLVTPEEIEQKIIPAFATFGITPAHLDKILGAPRSAGWTEEHRLQLRKILVALKQDETTVRELLEGLVDSKPKSSGTPSGGASINDLVGGNGHSSAAVTRPPETHSAPPVEASHSEASVDQSETQDIIEDEWFEAIDSARTIEEVRQIAAKANDITDSEIRNGMLKRCLSREEQIRGARGERANGNGSAQKPVDPLEWTRQQAEKAATFQDFKRLDGQIGEAKWSEETKAEARKLVAAEKEARKGK